LSLVGVCLLGSASDDVIARLANQDTASMLSFSSSTNATSSSSNYHSQHQQLGTKVGGAWCWLGNGCVLFQNL